MDNPNRQNLSVGSRRPSQRLIWLACAIILGGLNLTGWDALATDKLLLADGLIMGAVAAYLLSFRGSCSAALARTKFGAFVLGLALVAWVSLSGALSGLPLLLHGGQHGARFFLADETPHAAIPMIIVVLFLVEFPFRAASWRKTNPRRLAAAAFWGALIAVSLLVIGRADSRVVALDGLDPQFSAKLAQMETLLAERGLTVQRTCGRRSFEWQNRIYAQGRTRPGAIVTKARGGYSLHNFGLAADYVFMNGETPNWNGPWKALGEAARESGLEWGGDWRTFKDNPHVQLTYGLPLWGIRLRNGVRSACGMQMVLLGLSGAGLLMRRRRTREEWGMTLFGVLALLSLLHLLLLGGTYLRMTEQGVEYNTHSSIGETRYTWDTIRQIRRLEWIEGQKALCCYQIRFDDDNLWQSPISSSPGPAKLDEAMRYVSFRSGNGVCHANLSPRDLAKLHCTTDGLIPGLDR